MSDLKKIESPSHLEAFRQNILSSRESGGQAVKICCTTGCRAGGALKIIDEFEKELSEKGLEGKVEIKKTGCRGFCEKGPVMVVEPENLFYNQVEPEDVPDIVAKTLTTGEPVQRLLLDDGGSDVVSYGQFGRPFIVAVLYLAPSPTAPGAGAYRYVGTLTSE